MFNGMWKAPLQKNSRFYNVTHWENKGVHTFTKGISPNVEGVSSWCNG